MSSLNKAQLIGRVGKDPEIRVVNSNVSVANFSLATSEKYVNKNGDKVESTEWHNIVIWNKLAEVVEKYVRKGDLLYLSGKIVTRSWDDKDGVKRYTTEIKADEMIMLGTKNTKAGEEQQEKSSKVPESTVSETEKESGVNDNNPVDDLPF